MVLSLTY